MLFGYDIMAIITSMNSDLITVYVLIAVLMFLNIVILTPPSELIGIAIGIAVYLTDLNWFLAILIATVANFLGTLVWYYVGYFRFGKKGKNKLMSKIEEAYLLEGRFLVFLLRFVPLIRAFCSYPAGKIRMKMWDFALYSIPGLMLWMIIWSVLGMVLGQLAVKYHILVSVAMGITVYLIIKISLTRFGKRLMSKESG